MKRTLSVLLALAFGVAAFGQKPAMDHDVYDSWQRVGGVELSADGTFLTWSVVPQEGDGTLFIKRTTDGKVLEIPRAAGLKMSPVGDWAYCSIKPEFQATRKAKIEKKKKDGWEFLFIGANIDAVTTAATFGIDENRAVDYRADAEGTRVLYSAVGSAITKMRKCAKISEDWAEEICEDYNSRK